MCFPVALGAIGHALGAGAATSSAAIATGSAAISGVSSALGFIGQRQTARAQERAQAVAMSQERERMLREARSMRQREAQDAVARSQQLMEISRQSSEASARARVAAGESMVGGISSGLLFDEFDKQSANYQAALLQQQGYDSANVGLALGDAEMRYQRNITALNRPVQKAGLIPSVLGASQNISGAYLGGLQLHKASTTPKLP